MKKKIFPIVLFNREYIYIENLIVLLLFLGLKTHTFTEFKRKFPLPFLNIRMDYGNTRGYATRAGMD